MQRAVKPDEAEREPRVVTRVSVITGEEESTTYSPRLTEWQVTARKAVHGYEEKLWQAAVRAKPKLELYSQWKLSLRRENYLTTRDVIARTMFFRIRCGTNNLRMETGRNEWVLDEATGLRRRMEREERTCRQCGTGAEDEIHILLYCPHFVEARRRLMQDMLAEVTGEDASLRTFLQGLGNESTIMEDREQAEKALRMMMGKKLIWKTMELTKRIMRQRAALIRRAQPEETDTEESDSDDMESRPQLFTGRTGPNINEVRSRRRGKRSEKE